MMDRTEFRVCHNLSGLFQRLPGALPGSDRRRRDAFGLVQVENVRPADERNSGRTSVPTDDRIARFVVPIEEFVVNDGRGFLALFDVSAQVECLFEAHPEWRLEFGGTEEERINTPILLSGNHVLDAEPWFLPGHRALFQLLDKAISDGLINIPAHNQTSCRAASIAD